MKFFSSTDDEGKNHCREINFFIADILGKCLLLSFKVSHSLPFLALLQTYMIRANNRKLHPWERSRLDIGKEWKENIFKTKEAWRSNRENLWLLKVLKFFFRFMKKRFIFSTWICWRHFEDKKRQFTVFFPSRFLCKLKDDEYYFHRWL